VPTPLLDNRQLGTDTARLNLLTNGGFEIWQRGAGSFTTSGAWTADRWQMFFGGASTAACTYDVGVADNSGRSARVIYTHAAGGIVYLEQLVEATALKGRVVSLSVRPVVTAGTVSAQLYSDGATPLNVVSNGNTQNVTWETLRVSGTVPTDATKLYVRLFCPGVSASVYWDNAMLVVGSVPADYAPMHPADELERCLRYCETFSRGSSGNVLAGGYLFATTNATFTYFWKVNKAVTPTVTFSPVANFTIQSNGAATGVTAFSIYVTATDGLNFGVTGSVGFGVVGGNGMLNAAGGATATITAEANP